MKVRWFLPIIFPVFAGCHQTMTEVSKENGLSRDPLGRVADIPLPEGFTRIEAAENSFAH